MACRFPLLLPLCALALVACGSQEPGEDPAATQQSRLGQPARYDIDPATGAVSAEHTDAQGTTTRLAAGERLPVALPEPFTAFPDAEIVHNTRVEQGDGRLVYLDFATGAPVDAVTDFYRGQARKAGIVPHIDIEGQDNRTLGGENRALQLRFSLTARRDGPLTKAQLVVGKAF